MPSVEWRPFYNSKAWKKTRRAKLDRDPLCEDCLLTNVLVNATDVDHVQRLSEGGHPTDPNNLRSLCHPHHARKTGLEKNGLPVHLADVGEDGWPVDPLHPFHAGDTGGG